MKGLEASKEVFGPPKRTSSTAKLEISSLFCLDLEPD
jgi:hypothetical protein